MQFQVGSRKLTCFTTQVVKNQKSFKKVLTKNILYIIIDIQLDVSPHTKIQ